MMCNCCVIVVQLNCQRSYGVLCDVGRVMTEKRVSVALLQELYRSGVRMYCPAPGGCLRANVHLPGRQLS